MRKIGKLLNSFLLLRLYGLCCVCGGIEVLLQLEGSIQVFVALSEQWTLGLRASHHRSSIQLRGVFLWKGGHNSRGTEQYWDEEEEI